MEPVVQEEIEIIKNHYHPVQPAIKQSDENVTYQEFIPHKKLQDFIYCYWQLKTTTTLREHFTYRVVADGCIDIFFELNNPSENFVMGFCKKYTEFQLEDSFNYVGVRFLPTMFPQIFKVNAAELSNKFERLEWVDPETSKFIKDNFQKRFEQHKVKTLLDQYFLTLLSRINLNPDHRLYNAINRILTQPGFTKIETDLETGISPRQLRRLCKFYIGDTAKTFSKVIRFQHILQANPSLQSLRQNKIFYDVGFYDQAHFIKDFKNFYGLTPTKALSPDHSQR